MFGVTVAPREVASVVSSTITALSATSPFKVQLVLRHTDAPNASPLKPTLLVYPVLLSCRSEPGFSIASLRDESCHNNVSTTLS